MPYRRYREKCKVWFCERPASAKGMCERHYQAACRYGGDPIGKKNDDFHSVLERFHELLVAAREVSDAFTEYSERSDCAICLHANDAHDEFCAVSIINKYWEIVGNIKETET